MVTKIVESNMRLRLESTAAELSRTVEYRDMSVEEILQFPGWSTWTEDQFLKWYEKPRLVSIAGMKEFPVCSYNKNYSSKKVVIWEPDSVPEEIKELYGDNRYWSKGWDSSYKTFENRAYSKIDEINQGGPTPVEKDPEDEIDIKDLKAPWTHEKCALLLKKVAPYYGFRVRKDPETSYWTGFDGEGKNLRTLLRKWRDFTEDLRVKLDLSNESQWSHEYSEGRPSRGITTSLSYYYNQDWTFALVVKEKVFTAERKVWFSLWFEKI